MSGKPKELVAQQPRTGVASIDITPGKLTDTVTVTFSDGSGRKFEAPRMGGKAEEFAAALR
jgi:hypothetical protein